MFLQVYENYEERNDYICNNKSSICIKQRNETIDTQRRNTPTHPADDGCVGWFHRGQSLL